MDNSLRKSRKPTALSRLLTIISAALLLAGTMFTVSPAQAATPHHRLTAADVQSAVQRADTHLGLGANGVRVIQHGATEMLPRPDGSTPPLTVTAGASASSADSQVTYTSATLDGASTQFAGVFASDETNTASWTFVAGTQLSLLSDGRVSASDGSGDFVAGIDAPWAVDANGNHLSTYYTVKENTLTQHIAYTPDTVFPVVADPKVTVYPFYYVVTLTHAESIIAVSTVAACAALFSKSPVPAMRALTIGCTIFAAYGTP